MGATTFVTTGAGSSATAAFAQAKQEERDGLDIEDEGYTGTILEKDKFTFMNVPAGTTIQGISQFVETWLDENDDKWGPAGCIDNDNGTYTFFGWASC